MTKIAVFGGTTEGRHIAEFCNENKIKCTYFAATEAGKNEVANCSSIEIIQGRLNKEEMRKVFEKALFNEVIDATHPYAVEVSENIKEACNELGISYLRILRDDDECEENEEITYSDNIDELINHLNLRDENILVTTGSKDAESYKKVNDFKNRVYLRVLPDNATIDKLCGYGFLREHIITGKGPFSLEENIKALNDTNSRLMVTKESGKSGGYYEKIKAAKVCGCEVFCIRRPKEYGISELEAMRRLSYTNKNSAYIIGIGMGATELLSSVAKRLINGADVIIGAERMISSCKELISDSAEIFISHDTDKIVAEISNKKDMTIAVLMSGDTGFFSGAKKLAEKLNRSTEIIAGIASMSYLASKIGISWDDAYAVSMHGRKGNLPFAVLTHEKTFVLTDGNINEIMELLREYNLPDVTIYIGKNLSMENERVFKVMPKDYIDLDENLSLTSLFIINDKHENRMRFIHDSEFIRNETPMTKETVRNHIVSRFNVNENSVIFDIGSGTGSVSLMLARITPNGKVFAFDTSIKAIEVLEENKRKFSTDHVIGILGTVPQCIEENNLPLPDAVFIGGSNGNLKNIIALFEGKNIPLVLTAIATETFYEVMGLIEEGRIKSAEISQLFSTESVELGRYHIMKPQNPIWIISGIL